MMQKVNTMTDHKNLSLNCSIIRGQHGWHHSRLQVFVWGSGVSLRLLPPNSASSDGLSVRVATVSLQRVRRGVWRAVPYSEPVGSSVSSHCS
jgi:hypothetical protein